MASFLTDFIAELRHIQGVLDEGSGSGILQLDRGLDTMLVVAAAHESATLGRSVHIDYGAGYVPDAIRSN